MKRLLLILGFALMAVACNKDDDLDGAPLVLFTPKDITINKETGGVVTVRTHIDAYVKSIVKIFSSDSSNRDIDSKAFFRTRPPEYLITIEDIMKYDEYETDGCKVIPNGFQEYDIIVEPNCDCDVIQVYFAEIYESKKHGKIGSHISSIFRIQLE